MNNTIIIPIKTEADIIAAVNAKSHITAACFKLDDNDTVNLVDAFGNVDNITLDAAPDWNSGNAGEPDGFIELNNGTATASPSCKYTTPGSEASKASHNALLKTSDVGDGDLIFNFWINSPLNIDPAAQESLMAFGSAAAGDSSYALIQSGTNLEFQYNSGAGKFDAEIPNGNFTNNTWHNITIDISADSIDIYLDGDSAAIDSISGSNYELNVDPANNGAESNRGFHFLCNGRGGVAQQITASSNRTVYLGRFLIIKSTTTQAANIASIVQGLYRKGLSGFAPELLDL